MTTAWSTLHNVCRSKWLIPALCLVAGLIYLGASITGGWGVWNGLELFGIMVVFGLVVLLAGRSETIRGLRGDGRDERFWTMDLRATANAGMAGLVVVLGAGLWEYAHGRSIMPYAWPCVVAAVVYVASIIYLRVRG